MKALLKKEFKENFVKFVIETVLLVGITFSLFPYGYRLTQRINPNLLNSIKIMGNASNFFAKLKDINFFIYSQWFGKNLFEMALLFAVVNAVGIIAGETERKTAVFLFSRPVSRAKIFSAKLIAVILYTLLPIVLSTYLIIPLSHNIPQKINLVLMNKLLFQSLVATTAAISLTIVFSVLINDRVKAGIASFAVIIASIALGSVKTFHRINFINFYIGKFSVYVTSGIVLSAILIFTALFLLLKKEI